MDPKLEAASGDEQNALNQPSGLAVDNTAQTKKFIIIGVLVLSLLIIASLGYYLVRNGSLPDAVVPDILQQPKEEVTIKEIIAEEDLAARYASTTKTMDERLEQLYIALQTSGNTNIPPYTPSDTKLAIKTWNTPDPETKIEDGAAFSADGTYSIPANWFGFITIYENGTPIGRQVLDNRDKADTTTTFSIPLGNYIPGPKEYRMEIEGAAACRLACSPSDEDCQIYNEKYCGADSRKENYIIYKNREINTEARPGSANLTCIEEEFVSGPRNNNDNDSCLSSGFLNPPHVRALRFLDEQQVSENIRSSYIEDLIKFDKQINEKNTNIKIENNVENTEWTIQFEAASNSSDNVCKAKVKFRISCTK